MTQDADLEDRIQLIDKIAQNMLELVNKHTVSYEDARNEHEFKAIFVRIRNEISKYFKRRTICYYVWGRMSHSTHAIFLSSQAKSYVTNSF